MSNVPKRAAQVAPAIIGPSNAEPATGWPWRFVRSLAKTYGVPFVGTAKKQGVRADLFLAALDKHGSLTTAENETQPTPSAIDPAAQVRAMLGKKTRGGVR